MKVTYRKKGNKYIRKYKVELKDVLKWTIDLVFFVIVFILAVLCLVASV